MLTNILFFVHIYIVPKIEKKKQMEKKVMVELKLNFSNHWLMVRLNLSWDNVRNWEETTTFMKVFEKIFKCKKKGIFNLVYKQGLLLKKFKKVISLKKCIRKMM